MTNTNLDVQVTNYIKDASSYDPNDPTKLDMFVVDLVGDWLEKKVSDELLSRICMELESEPMHHLMYNNKIVYYGIKLDKYISEKDDTSLNELKEKIAEWYNNL